MGWFKSTPSTGKISADGKPEAPNRHDRQHCWEARDAFFACLDRNNILDGIKDDTSAQKQCGAESVVFDRNCAQTWVEYFKKRRVMEYNKKKAIERVQAQGGTVLSDPTVTGPPR